MANVAQFDVDVLPYQTSPRRRRRRRSVNHVEMVDILNCGNDDASIDPTELQGLQQRETEERTRRRRRRRRRGQTDDGSLNSADELVEPLNSDAAGHVEMVEMVNFGNGIKPRGEGRLECQMSESDDDVFRQSMKQYPQHRSYSAVDTASFEATSQSTQAATTEDNLAIQQPGTINQSARKIDNQQRHVQFLAQQQSSRYSQSSFRQLEDIPHKSPTFVDMISRINPSAWMVVSLGLLFVSSLVFVVSFVTNSWGTMVIYAIPDASGGYSLSAASFALENSHWNISAFVAASQLRSGNDAAEKGASQPTRSERRWYFGLWRCCRDDGLCLGTRWPAFYSAARTFAVLALFGHALSFAWIFGHTLEKLLDYDPCTMMSLVSACFSTTIFVVIAVCVYGVMWPTQFHQMVHDASPNYDSVTSLGYSFYLAVVTAPLTAASGVCAVVDFHGNWRDFEAQHKFAEYDDDETEEEFLDGASAESSDVRNAETVSGSAVVNFETSVHCSSSAARAPAAQNTPAFSPMDTSLWTEESLV